MKILYARTQFWFNLKSGGSVGHTLGVLDGFRQNGCELKVISNERFLGIDNFNYYIIKPKIKRPSWLGEFLYNFYAKDNDRKCISKFKANLIYHRYTGYTFFVAKIAKELNIPLILEFNSFATWTIKYWKESRNFFKRAIKKYLLYNILKQIEIYNLKTASLIITVSQPLKLDLLKMGISENKILVNPNGVEPEKFSPDIIKNEKCKDLKQILSITNNNLIVGFTGTFGVWHGIPQLTEAIDKILRNQLFPDIHFLLMGDGELKSKAENQIGYYKNVTFTGEVSYSNIQYYLAICDILVSPHNPQVDGREFFGSPTKLFEYMIMGKGIVASKLGQIGKVLEHRKTAWLVKPGDVSELIEGILTLAKDKKLRNFLGKNAREEVIANYTWQKNVEKVINKLRML